MKLKEAYEKLSVLSGIPFSKLFSPDDFQTIVRNKGKTGQLLELALGMKLSSSNLDFEDGELKTNKCHRNGNPMETVFVTQIASVIDDLFASKPFECTHLFQKIRNILYVPVCKEGTPESWMFLESIHVDLKQPAFALLYDIWENDYYCICEQLRRQAEASLTATLHTASGRHLQIRTKDAVPYHPIYSQRYHRYVSDKNRAFYFQKQFVYDIRKLNGS